MRKPIEFLIPGRLEAFDFRMKRVADPDDSTAEFHIYISNWFLRLFAPKLVVRYDKKFGRITWYKGISAIPDSSGNTREITIDYKY